MPCATCGAAHDCPLQIASSPASQGSPMDHGLDKVRSPNGILNINKPAGMTSHDVVAVIRRISGESRVGHAGTLDPMATGVLLIRLGQGTRIAEYLTDHDKKYRAHIRLGV